jgi:hypothetical protein
MEASLGPVPPLQRQSYDAVCEVYGSTRTILSCLDRELLDKVKGQGRRNRGLLAGPG